MSVIRNCMKSLRLSKLGDALTTEEMLVVASLPRNAQLRIAAALSAEAANIELNALRISGVASDTLDLVDDTPADTSEGSGEFEDLSASIERDEALNTRLLATIRSVAALKRQKE